MGHRIPCRTAHPPLVQLHWRDQRKVRLGDARCAHLWTYKSRTYRGEPKAERLLKSAGSVSEPRGMYRIMNSRDRELMNSR